MIRKLLLAVAIALPLMTFAGTGVFTGGVAHAAGILTGPTTSPFSCDSTSYNSMSSGPYYLDYCLVGESDGADQNGPDTDDDSGYQNWAGGTESYSGLGCLAASITTGKDYYNPTGWTEFDTFNPVNYTYTVHAHCTVQTGDTGITHNLFAYLDSSECDLQLFGDYALYGSGINMATGPGYIGSSQLYEAESPSGAVTLYCTATAYSVP